jgi:hypothetical protein
MSWTELLKAKIKLPQANIEKWLEIFSTDENTDRFRRQLRGGNFENTGLNRTLTFLRGEHTEQNLINAASLDYNEDELIDRFNEHKDSFISHFENRTNRLKGIRVDSRKVQGETLAIENKKRLFALFDDLVENVPKGKIKVASNWGRKLIAIEKYLVEHPKILRKIRNELLQKYSNFFSGFSIPGRAPPTGEGSELYDATWWDKSERRLKELIKLFGSATKLNDYTSNTLDDDHVFAYYINIAKHHRLLIPEEIAPPNSDLFRVTKRQYKINPNIKHLLRSNDPITSLGEETAKVYEQLEEVRPKQESEARLREIETEIYSRLGPKPLYLPELFVEEYILDELNELEGRTDEEWEAMSDRDITDDKENLKLLRDYQEFTDVKDYEFEGRNYKAITAKGSIKHKLARYYKNKLKEYSLEDEENYQLHEDLIVTAQDMPKHKNVSEALDTINLETLDGEAQYKFGTITDFLNVIIEADRALDLNNLPEPLPENLVKAFDEALGEGENSVKSKLKKLAQDKVDDIATNPKKYERIPPIKSAAFEGDVEIQAEHTIFTALINGGFINARN